MLSKNMGTSEGSAFLLWLLGGDSWTSVDKHFPSWATYSFSKPNWDPTNKNKVIEQMKIMMPGKRYTLAEEQAAFWNWQVYLVCWRMGCVWLWAFKNESGCVEGQIQLFHINNICNYINKIQAYTFNITVSCIQCV